MGETNHASQQPFGVVDTPESEVRVDTFTDAIDDSTPRFVGHPALDGSEAGSDADATESEEVGPTEVPEDELAQREQADTAQTTAEELPPDGSRESDAPGFKYTNQEAAERAAQEAARRMHEATQETAELRRRLEMLEAQESTRQRERMEAERASRTPGPINAQERMVRAMREAQQIDPDDDGALDKQTEILAEAWRDIETRMSEHFEYNRQEAERIAREAAMATQNEVRSSVDASSQRESVRQAIVAAAQAAGLEVEDVPDQDSFAGQHGADLWEAVTNQRYPVNATQEEAIEAVIGVVKERFHLNGPPPATNDALTEAARREQQRNAPLERSGATRTAQQTIEEQRPLSWDEALNGTMQQRRL